MKRTPETEGRKRAFVKRAFVAPAIERHAKLPAMTFTKIPGAS